MGTVMGFVWGLLGAGAVAALVGLLALVFRKALLEWVGGAVKHHFERELEVLKGEIQGQRDRLEAERRERAADTEALRRGALESAAAHQAELGKRRTEAVDEIWRAVIELGKLKLPASTAQILKLDALSEDIRRRGKEAEKVVKLADLLLGSLSDIDNMPQVPFADRVRPFIPEITFALFSAYRTVLTYPYMQLYAFSKGTDFGLVSAPDHIVDLVASALPQRAEYAKQCGYPAVLGYIPELEASLLQSLRDALTFNDGDQRLVQRAAEINEAVLAVKPAPGVESADLAPVLAQVGL